MEYYYADSMMNMTTSSYINQNEFWFGPTRQDALKKFLDSSDVSRMYAVLPDADKCNWILMLLSRMPITNEDIELIKEFLSKQSLTKETAVAIVMNHSDGIKITPANAYTDADIKEYIDRNIDILRHQLSVRIPSFALPIIERIYSDPKELAELCIKHVEILNFMKAPEGYEKYILENISYDDIADKVYTDKILAILKKLTKVEKLDVCTKEPIKYLLLSPKDKNDVDYQDIIVNEVASNSEFYKKLKPLSLTKLPEKALNHKLVFNIIKDLLDSSMSMTSFASSLFETLNWKLNTKPKVKISEYLSSNELVRLFVYFIYNKKNNNDFPAGFFKEVGKLKKLTLRNYCTLIRLYKKFDKALLSNPHIMKDIDITKNRKYILKIAELSDDFVKKYASTIVKCIENDDEAYNILVNCSDATMALLLCDYKHLSDKIVQALKDNGHISNAFIINLFTRKDEQVDISKESFYYIIESHSFEMRYFCDVNGFMKLAAAAGLSKKEFFEYFAKKFPYQALKALSDKTDLNIILSILKENPEFIPDCKRSLRLINSEEFPLILNQLKIEDINKFLIKYDASEIPDSVKLVLALKGNLKNILQIEK